jgi:cytochrome c peroxidase
MRSAVIPLLACAALMAACAREPVDMAELDEPYIVQLPPGAPTLPVPGENALTKARVQLGKALFFEKELSLGNGIACATCHLPEHAFSDTSALSHGVGGATGLRNSPTLANLAWHQGFFRDGGVPTLEQQVLAPIHDEVEMASNINDAAALLRDREPYASLSRKAYDRALDGFVITRAIACYERTLVSGWSRYDRFQYQGDATALSADERHGRELFNSDAAGCSGCHSGFDLSDHTYRNIGTALDHTDDPGRERITLQPGDRGKFKVPTLRNVALTAPYLHDGSMSTLEEVVEHFASGGVNDPNKDPLVVPLALSPQDKADLVAFLRSLTDDRSLDQVP